MTTSLERIRRGASYLGIISVVAICGYYYLSGHTWLESIYWFVITVSSVGYTEDSTIPPELQAFSIAVIIVGMMAAGYTIGGLIQMMTEGEIDRALGIRRITRGIEKLEGHVIICGFGRFGKTLAEELLRNKELFVVIDVESTLTTDAQSLKYLVVTGDATDEDILLASGIKRAKTLVCGLNNDVHNVYLTLTARNLNPDIKILARGEHPSSEKKMFQAGAHRVVLPAVIGARRVATMVTHPNTADILEQAIDRKVLEVELEEIVLSDRSSMMGKTVGNVEAFKNRRLLVVAVRPREGKMVFNPSDSYQFVDGDTMILMGRAEDFATFRKMYQV